MALSKFLLFQLSLLTGFLLLCSPSSSQKVEDEDFSYISGSKNGPEHWGEINKNWTICGQGQLQSPIDLTDKRVKIFPHLGKLRRSYRPGNAIIKNLGHDIMLEWLDEAGGIWINGTEYLFKQLHWHSPSEHTINSRRYNLEMHMVHKSADGKIAVVGFLYTIGHADPFLAKLEAYIKKISNAPEAEEKVGLVDPRDVKRGSRKYYRYLGSLTTPPCTEGVVWTIVKKVRTVSREQLTLLKEAVNDDSEMNARPKQRINGRVIGLYRPEQKVEN